MLCVWCSFVCGRKVEKSKSARGLPPAPHKFGVFFQRTPHTGVDTIRSKTSRGGSTAIFRVFEKKSITSPCAQSLFSQQKKNYREMRARSARGGVWGGLPPGSRVSEENFFSPLHFSHFSLEKIAPQAEIFEARGSLTYHENDHCTTC